MLLLLMFEKKSVNLSFIPLSDPQLFLFFFQLSLNNPDIVGKLFLA